MTTKKNKIEITIPPTENDSQEVINNLTHDLYVELLDLGLSPPLVQLNSQESLSTQSRGEPILPTILIALATAGFFNAMIEAIKSWSLRKESRKVRVKVQFENKMIEYEYPPSSTSQEDLIKMTNEIVRLLDNDEAEFSSDEEDAGQPKWL
jgi:hypothetical protein